MTLNDVFDEIKTLRKSGLVEFYFAPGPFKADKAIRCAFRGIQQPGATCLCPLNALCFNRGQQISNSMFSRMVKILGLDHSTVATIAVAADHHDTPHVVIRSKLLKACGLAA